MVEPAQLDRLYSEAWLEARALGHHWVGTEHLFLAMLAAEDRPARRALNDCGLEHDALAAALAVAAADMPGEPPEPHDLEFPRTTPAAYRVMGRAEGLAAGLGVAEATVEHLLIACVWDPSNSAYVEECSGVTREAIFEHLRALGVAVPRTALPSALPRSS